MFDQMLSQVFVSVVIVVVAGHDGSFDLTAAVPLLLFLTFTRNPIVCSIILMRWWLIDVFLFIYTVKEARNHSQCNPRCTVG